MATRCIIAFLAGFLLAWAFQVHAAEVPDDAITPGVVRNLSAEKICSTKWGADRRNVTKAMKAEAYARYNLAPWEGECAKPKGCEVDHRVPRELGGEDNIDNLWAEPFGGSCNAHNKDRLENRVHKEMCAGDLTLEDAQAIFLGDWRPAYVERFGPC